MNVMYVCEQPLEANSKTRPLEDIIQGMSGASSGACLGIIWGISWASSEACLGHHLGHV
jgi:hypothetical protein